MCGYDPGAHLINISFNVYRRRTGIVCGSARREILTLGALLGVSLGEGFTTLVVTLWCFNTVGCEILTLGEGFTTQVVTLWCFNTVGREILTLGEGFTTQVVTLWCFNTVGRETLTLGEGFTTRWPSHSPTLYADA
jgi:hypothetical protein